jgi:hypothetical protein
MFVPTDQLDQLGDDDEDDEEDEDYQPSETGDAAADKEIDEVGGAPLCIPLAAGRRSGPRVGGAEKSQ